MLLASSWIYQEVPNAPELINQACDASKAPNTKSEFPYTSRDGRCEGTFSIPVAATRYRSGKIEVLAIMNSIIGDEPAYLHARREAVTLHAPTPNEGPVRFRAVHKDRQKHYQMDAHGNTKGELIWPMDVLAGLGYSASKILIKATATVKGFTQGESILPVAVQTGGQEIKPNMKTVDIWARSLVHRHSKVDAKILFLRKTKDGVARSSNVVCSASKSATILKGAAFSISLDTKLLVKGETYTLRIVGHRKENGIVVTDQFNQLLFWEQPFLAVLDLNEKEGIPETTDD